ncbi:MAG: rhomboid family intramembrane serine protease [Thermoleophilaceae bacterium]
MDVCYRHRDRETGVSCASCGRPICPECMTATPVGMRCPECSGQRTRVRTLQSASDEPVLTYVLVGLNVAVALGGLLSGGSAGAGGVGTSDILEHGALSRDSIAAGEYWRLLTSGFLHAGLFHLAFNMLALWILGGMLEPAIGRLRFGLIYLVSLLAGSFGALLLQPNGFTLGASGAVFGLMAAAAVVLRRRGISLMQSGLGFWIGLNLLITFSPGSNISIGAHLGGLVGGGLAALLMFELGERFRPSTVVPAALCLALAAAAVAGAIAVSSSAA